MVNAQCCVVVEPTPYLALRYEIGYDPLILAANGPSEIEVPVYNLGDKFVELPHGATVAVMSEADEPDDEDVGSVLVLATASDTGPEPEVLSLVKIGTEGIDPQSIESLKRLIRKHSGVFALHDDDLGLTTAAEHLIDVGDSNPIKQAPRRLPYGDHREAVDRSVAQLMRAGAIRPSNSPWASPVVMVKKKDGTVRMCVDYRRLNDVTRKDSFPLPRLDESLDAFAGARYFTCLDIQMAYHQVPVREQDKAKTAFVTRSGLYEYEVLPFGLSNAPATFQRLMGVVLHGLIGRCCVAYLDDIVIFSRTLEEHLAHLDEVLGRLALARLKMKPRK